MRRCAARRGPATSRCGAAHAPRVHARRQPVRPVGGRPRLSPQDVGGEDGASLHRHLSERSPGARAAPSTSARKLAALRALFASQREHGRISQNPAELVSTPRRGSHLPRVLSAREAAACSRAFPPSNPLDMRDRAMFELAYSCGLRAEEIVSLHCADVDYDGEQLRVEGKGRKTRFVPVGEPAMAAVRAYLERGRKRSRSGGGARGILRHAQAHAHACARRAGRAGRAVPEQDRAPAGHR